MLGMIGEIMNKIKESKVFKSMINFISDVKNAILGNNKVAGAKDFVDNSIDENKASNTGSTYSYAANRILAFFNSKKFNNFKNNKFVRFMGKFIAIGFALAFGALVAYIMFKILPRVLVIIATIMAISIIVEIVLGLLGNLFKTNEAKA